MNPKERNVVPVVPTLINGLALFTGKLNNKLEIVIKDDGRCISQKIMDKVLQPFFTTKPARQETGLGLSRSYDIIKSHGGELTVESKVKEGALF